MSSSPESHNNEEGEIFESEVEKAPPSLPSVSGPSVDRHSSKRRRDSVDHSPQDPRSFKPRYESNSAAPPAIRRPRVSYADIDKSDTRNLFRDEQYDDRYRSKRSRTRSRSPPSRRDQGRGSGGRRGYYDDRSRRDGREWDRYHDGNSRQNGHRRSRDRSIGERGAHPVFPDRSRREAEARSKDSERGGDRYGGSNETLNGSRRDERMKEDGPAVEIEEPVDEAKLIEERRKKREAIKAKYRGQATPLLVSALGIKDTPVPDSPTPDSPVSVPADITDANSPRTPASPKETPSGAFDIAKESSTAGDVAAEEPSAADYDPTIDMQEDRNRNEKRRQSGHEVSSGAYNEIQSTDRDVLIEKVAEPAPAEHKKKASGDDDFDMFADVDEDDMFAPTSPTKSAAQPTVAKAVPIVEAKQLDASLLDNWDDQEGYYKIIPGELLDGRYRVQMSLGKGMFSGVVRALDMTTNKDSAIKIIRNNETMRKAGMKEIEILRTIREADPDDKRHLVRLERYFEHKGHLCIVFENLNINLREVLKKSGIRDVGISLRAVRAYAQQMFLGLSLLRKCNILHADLKPDNVLVSENQNLLKICDLGSASDASENEITPYLVSRFYRAPEIILGMPYDFAIDMWSIGCTLYELYTGKILFTGRTNNQMLRSIMECRGKFSNKLLRKGQFAPIHFDDFGNFRSIEKDKITGKDIVRTLTFAKPTRELKQRLLSAASGSETEAKELNLFVDLLEKCLNLNPEKRCTPNEALKHPFIYRPAVGGK